MTFDICVGMILDNNIFSRDKSRQTSYLLGKVPTILFIYVENVLDTITVLSIIISTFFGRNQIRNRYRYGAFYATP